MWERKCMQLGCPAPQGASMPTDRERYSDGHNTSWWCRHGAIAPGYCALQLARCPNQRQVQRCCDRYKHEFASVEQPMELNNSVRGSFEDRMQYVQQLCGRQCSLARTESRVPRRWIDLVYPRDMACGTQESCFRRSKSWMGEASPDMTRAAQKPASCSEELPLSHFHARMGSDSRHQAPDRHPQTFLVAETGEWRKRQVMCLCRQLDCPGVSQQRGTAYMVVKVQRMSTGVERFWYTKLGLELKIGVLTTNTKHGFQLATTAGAALQVHHKTHAYGQDNNTIVLRGCVSGLGCKRGGVLWCQTFRPVCGVDYVVTRYQ